VAALEIENYPDDAYSLSAPLGSVSSHLSPFSAGRREIWNFMLERDEAHCLYLNSAHDVVQWKARLESLQAALSIV
jgi:hypothetical protein